MEVIHVQQWMQKYCNEEVGIQKELSFSLISFLLRRCDELEYIDLGDLKNKLNSILHAHMVEHMDDGSIFYKSDYDLKYNKVGTVVNFNFTTELIENINNWIKDK